jgi:lauroyl/myristoyl acyltransferase
MSTDHLVSAARELIELGAGGYAGPHTDAFIEEVGRQHAAGALYRKATAKAIAGRDLRVGSPEEAAAGVYRNFIWTHFVCKLLMTASPVMAIQYARTRLDIRELEAALAQGGSAILSCFHYTGYPLMALRLGVSPMAPLISKARVDFLESSSERISDRVVYLSDRSAPVRMTRALMQGRSVWVLLDVVLPTVRVIPTQFLGGGMNVGAGIETIARLSGRPCLPLFWELTDTGTTLRVGAPIFQVDSSDDAVIHEFVKTQAAFIAEYPTQWLEWYSVLDEAPGVRAEVKHANEELWARLARVKPGSEPRAIEMEGPGQPEV